MSNDISDVYREQLLAALERLLSTPATEGKVLLNQASQTLAEQLRADKVDIFFYDPTRDSLIARGTSDTPMSRKQVALGLERLPLSNDGRAVEVFRTGKPHLNGRVDEDEEELLGVRQGLGVKSQMAVQLVIGGEPRGVLSVQSAQPDFFSEASLRFLQAVSHWIGAMAHRAELGEELIRRAAQHARRAAAEEIITVLAHELGNHIGPLRARLEILRIRAERESHENNLRDTQSALLVVLRLTRLIHGLLDVARLEQGLFTLELRPTDLVALSRDVATELAAPDLEIQLRGEEELVVTCDPERIRQVLENLVTNAVKHSPSNAPIVVEVRQQQREQGPWALVHVIDQGPGISPEALPTLFERFVTGGRSKGLGLGLYLARQFAEEHGGTLMVDSKLGQGSRFELALPLQPPEE